MAVLADLERLLERVFERSTARLFRAHPQAVQLERRVERAMERARTQAAGRVTVPARYRVRLHPDDLAAAAAAQGGPEALAGRLADGALAFARAHGYHLSGRPTVSLVADPAVQLGVIEVDAVATAGRPQPDPPAPDDVPAPGPAAVPVARPVPDVPAVPPQILVESSSGSADGARWGPDAPVAEAPAIGNSPAPLSGGIRGGDGTRTLVFRQPAPAPARAILRMIAQDGSERTIEVDGTPLTLGRAADNGLVLTDARVSRHHARLQARRGTLVLTDLGSTNGSRVNGVRVDECALGPGDRILLGDTVLLVEQLPG